MYCVEERDMAWVFTIRRNPVEKSDNCMQMRDALNLEGLKAREDHEDLAEFPNSEILLGLSLTIKKVDFGESEVLYSR